MPPDLSQTPCAKWMTAMPLSSARPAQVSTLWCPGTTGNTIQCWHPSPEWKAHNTLSVFCYTLRIFWKCLLWFIYIFFIVYIGLWFWYMRDTFWHSLYIEYVFPMSSGFLSPHPHPTSPLWFILSCCIYIHNFKDLYKNLGNTREKTRYLCSWDWWNWCDTILSNHILLPVSNMTSSFFRMKETAQCVFIPFPLLLDT